MQTQYAEETQTPPDVMHVNMPLTHGSLTHFYQATSLSSDIESYVGIEQLCAINSTLSYFQVCMTPNFHEGKRDGKVVLVLVTV